MNKKLLGGSIAMVISGGAVALEPAGITTESSVVITPLLHSGLAYDNNILSQADDKVSSTIFTVAPSVNFLLDDGINQYQFDLGLASGTYLDSSDDNYFDADLGLSSHFEPSSSSRFDVLIEANWVTEPRGTGLSEGLNNSDGEPLRYNDQTAAMTYEYGAMSSNARIAVDAKLYNKGYSNLLFGSDKNSEIRNYDSIFLGSTFYYSTNSRTDAFVELNRDAIRYDVANGTSLDSDDVNALVGVKWQATALTTGSVKLGYQRKDFTSSGRKDFGGISWNAEIDWQPLTYTMVSFNTSRKARDPNVEGDYINESIYGVNWTHQWHDLLSSSIGINYTKEDYSGVATARVDDTTMLTASVDYSLRRWLDVSLYVESTDKDSTRENILFNKTKVGINFTMSL